jgi:hypothetical protein
LREQIRRQGIERRVDVQDRLIDLNVQLLLQRKIKNNAKKPSNPAIAAALRFGPLGQDAITIQHFDPTTVICAMKYLLASTLAAVIVVASTAAIAETPVSSDTPKQQCAIGYVTGVGGSAQSVREYLATPDRDKYRYLADNPIQCRVSDEGRASACTGITSLRHDKVSVYDDIDSETMAVVARVELDRGTYAVIIVVPRQDLQCEE